MAITTIIICVLFLGGLIGWTSWLFTVTTWFKAKKITDSLIKEIRKSIDKLKKDIRDLDRQ